MSQHAFQAQECYYFLSAEFSNLIDTHLPTRPIRGTRLRFLPINSACNWLVIIEVDCQGNLAGMTVQDIRSPDISHWHWDFIEETFNNCGEGGLDLYCGQGIFEIFQHAIPAHFSADNYSVTTTAL